MCTRRVPRTLQKNAKNYLYADVLSFLSQFPKESRAIVSRAHPAWQEETIRSSGLGERVSGVYIVQGDTGKRTCLETLRTAAPTVFHFDDEVKDIASISGLTGVLPVFLRRNHRSEPYGFESLLEAFEVVRPILAHRNAMV